MTTPPTEPTPTEYPVEIVWEAPPTAARNKLALYADALAKVKERPGSWARIRVYDLSGTAYSTRKRMKEHYRDEQWELRVVRIAVEPKEQWALYARFRTRDQMREAKP